MRFREFYRPVANSSMHSFRRHWFTEKEPLCRIALFGMEKGQLVYSLHPFGNDLHSLFRSAILAEHSLFIMMCSF